MRHAGAKPFPVIYVDGTEDTKYEPASKSQLKKIQKIWLRETYKQSNVAKREEEDAAKREKNLEEAKKITITEDKSLPAAKLIKIARGKDFRDQRVKIYGWVHRLRRQGKNLMFIRLRDVTGFLQSVLTDKLCQTYNALVLSTESSVLLYGSLKKVPKGKTVPGGHELAVDYWELAQALPDVQAENRHTLKILRTRSVLLQASRSMKSLKSYYQRADNSEDIVMAKQAVMELQNFIKTKPSDEKAISMLRHYLMTEDKTNVLHVSIKQNKQADVIFLLKMVYVWKQYHLTNIYNDQRKTALHIATCMHLEEIVSNLIVCKADASIGDSDMNTALHLAVITNAPTPIFEKLLSGDHVKKFIDNENNEGNTALNLAIENSNMRALKLLLILGADINKQHKKNGYTPLRFAIEKQNLDLVRYILQHEKLNPMIEDFKDINPLQAAMKKDNSELIDLITEFMRKNNYVDVEIKNEIEEYSDEEIEEKYSVKLEQISTEDLHQMYAKVTNFTPECLEEISRILDESQTWQNLADLLDLGHLTRSGLCDSKNSPTKLLLKVAIETNGDSVLQIRDFLENLDETRAVEIIDNMVRTQFC